MACHVRNSLEEAGAISRHGPGSPFRVFLISRRRLVSEVVAAKISVIRSPAFPFVFAERSKSSACVMMQSSEDGPFLIKLCRFIWSRLRSLPIWRTSRPVMPRFVDLLQLAT